jgi:serine/threonine-protein kinase
VATATAVATVAPAPKRTAVAVAATPETAQIYENGGLLHQVPWTIEVEDGKPVTIEIRADGFETMTLTLDGSETSRMVKLQPPKGAHPPGKGKLPGKKGGKGGDVIDPWGGH